ncbi:hypothetical protein [Shewanella sp. T24-MNA-CIBAN-0130]|uniref:hypothetical protein n=1 Tax=Shewanella sp. T24-MNA-CIBAN-0130 TaxID=3140470 RepID=UPI00331A2CCC
MLANLKIALGVAVIAIIALLLVSNESLKTKIAHKDNDLLQSAVSISALSSSNDNQAEHIKTLERDYRVITELNTQNRKRVADLEATHESRLQEAAQLRTSDDEPTKDWANALLPGDALRLLKSTNCQSGNTDQNGLCTATD